MAVSGARYFNVTISGLPGAGSTTLGKQLAKHLDFHYHSGGDFMRKYAIDNGYFDPIKSVHHVATAYPDDFDRRVDYKMRDSILHKRGFVYESWLSGFLAQQARGTFKILVYCSDDGVRVDRIANRDAITIAESKTHIFTREQENLKKWISLYTKEWNEWVVAPGTLPKTEPIYFWRKELYDLAIDTYRLGKEETLALAMKAVTQ
ncbi:MAG: Cytidylate kinase [Microgenomates group bacterium GW2011_GWC2_46_7]|nr:MAG: Cytidylate kinase [Microgenomates group bacterium GW2011_GWC2_46_7]